MSEIPQHTGPWFHRFLIRLFGVLLALLCFWLVEFIVNDIGRQPGPNYSLLEEQMLDPALIQSKEELAEQIKDTKQAINNLRMRQKLLRDSTDNSQRTMNQLLEFQRLRLEKNQALSPEEQAALADSQRLFLANQKDYQSLNERISELTEQLATLEADQRELEKELAEARRPLQEEYNRLWRRHKWYVAGMKLAVLIPLLSVTMILFLKLRSSVYAVIAYALGTAVVIRVGLVMHEYFPADFFKYILIGACLLVVLRVLFYLIGMLAKPQREWLLKQYREAYETFTCPACTFPIRRGPMKFVYWNRRSAKRLTSNQLASSETYDEPYTCPACATRVYEKCEKCDSTRPSMLPACPNCGVVKPLNC
ncbi:MAG: hypothetical protein D6698_16005 [Gammaproteobacteria bacterium]|nr:MAG: hypothetical protein D6698_16005 [Gammaproteobacteria bacterium]